MNVLGVFPPQEIRTGGQKRYAELSRQLVDRGHVLYHVVRRTLPVSLSGIMIPIIPDPPERDVRPSWWQYGRAVQKNLRTIRDAVGAKPDVILTFGETNYYAARVLGRAFRCPVVFALRSNFVDEFLQFGIVKYRLPFLKPAQRAILVWWKLRLERWFSKTADAVVFQTEYDRDNVASRVPQVLDRAEIIPNSFRVSWMANIPTKSRQPESFCRLLYLGSIGERKGSHVLFPAIKDVVRNGSTCFHLDVVGFGGLEAWARNYVAVEGLSDFVTFHGRIDAPLDRLAASDLLIVPSLYDSFPNTVLEALYIGTPVIGADAAGIQTMLKHKELLFERGSSAAIAESLNRLLENPIAYRQVKALCAERRSAFDFDWAERWEYVFLRAVRGG